MPQIKMCRHHLERRNFRLDKWLAEDGEECYVCVYGKYPDWEMPEGFDSSYAGLLDSHVKKLLEGQLDDYNRRNV